MNFPSGEKETGTDRKDKRGCGRGSGYFGPYVLTYRTFVRYIFIQVRTMTSLRAQLESVLGERISTPFTDLNKCVSETVSSGIHSVDSRTGGLPRGAITEIFGRASSGKTSILLSILAAATGREEVCAIIDGNDAFSPASGVEAGVELKRLLWVRCHNLGQTLKVTDLVLQSGGFGVVAMDLSDLPAAAVQAVPLATWFRFQRAIERTPTLLTIVSESGVARTCASLAIETTGGHFGFRVSEFGFEVNAEVIRNRQPNPKSEIRIPKSRSSHVRFNLHPVFSRPGDRS